MGGTPCVHVETWNHSRSTQLQLHERSRTNHFLLLGAPRVENQNQIAPARQLLELEHAKLAHMPHLSHLRESAFVQGTHHPKLVMALNLALRLGGTPQSSHGP